jgi:uncharacterized protein (DUF1810 family)
MESVFDLQRFVKAQQSIYAGALAELQQGRKTGHWMWFIFPQIAGLGHSATARHYAIASLEEARAYMLDPLLGERLATCTEVVNRIESCSARQIFGWPDEMKFKSCMTLFEAAAPENPVFGKALQKYFAGGRDLLTLERLAEA